MIQKRQIYDQEEMDMNAQGRVDVEFLAKAAKGRKVHLEKLMGVLDAVSYTHLTLPTTSRV